jgi:hypothetical protein
VAVIESGPLGRVERLIVATPLLFTEPVPMEDPLERKMTAPDVAGLPEAETVAVKFTEVPNVELVEDAASTVVVGAGATVTRTALEVEAAKLDVPA